MPFGNFEDRETFTSAIQVEVIVSPGPQAAEIWFQKRQKPAKIQNLEILQIYKLVIISTYRLFVRFFYLEVPCGQG